MKDKTKAQAKRRGPDWDAIERDYRTGNYTLRELEAKHHTDNATIARKIKRDRAVDPNKWQKDLASAIRQATKARVTADIISKEISETISSGQQSQQLVTVLVAAEINARILGDQRGRLTSLINDADKVRKKISLLVDSAKDIKDVATVVSAIESLSRTTKTLIDKEREAYNIITARDEDPGLQPNVETDPRAAYQWLAGQKPKST